LATTAFTLDDFHTESLNLNRDPSGRLNFAQKAILHADGVDFSSGASFKIKMDDFELFEELGKGNYGTVQKVLHRPTAVTMALKVRLSPFLPQAGLFSQSQSTHSLFSPLSQNVNRRSDSNSTTRN